MKYKKLTKEQILISLDRLTRFKNTKEKYIRVYSDILVSNLIEPKLRRTDIENMDYSILNAYVSEIFNASLKEFNNNLDCHFEDFSEESLKLNEYLKDYENSVFILDNDTQKLLDNTIDYISAIDLIPEDCPINLKWLKELPVMLNDFNNENPKRVRNDKNLKYPIEEVILVEGITEEILLPAFSKFLGNDFYAKGIQVIAAGGKNQVVIKYYELAEQLKLPIFVLLDKDAEDNIKQIQPRLRDIDRIHLVSCGEFEDLLPQSLIIKTVNSHFENFLTITENDLISELPTAKVLEELFKTKGLHEFKKAEFAKLVRDKISEIDDISPEIRSILREIFYTNKMLDSKFCS